MSSCLPVRDRVRTRLSPRIMYTDPIPCDMALPESLQIPLEGMVMIPGREPAILRQDADGLVRLDIWNPRLLGRS